MMAKYHIFYLSIYTCLLENSDHFNMIMVFTNHFIYGFKTVFMVINFSVSIFVKHFKTILIRFSNSIGALL
jgi:hypothetical protein